MSHLSLPKVSGLGRVLIAGLMAVGLIFAVQSFASTTPPTPVQPGTVPDITWGTSKADVDRTVSLMQQAGVRWIRTNISWTALETDRKGTFNTGNLAQYDYAISKAKAAGINVLMPVSDGVPYWASGDPNKYIDAGGVKHWNKVYRPANFQDYADFFRYVVNHYKGMDVHFYEVWNEPNLSWFWASGVNANEYFQMLKTTYPVIKAADPQSTVLLGGLSQGLNLPTESYYNYLQQLYSLGARSYFDIANIHMYQYDPDSCWNDADGKPSVQAFCSIGQIRNIMAANGDAVKDLWITEMGWSTCTPPGSCWGVTEQQQSDWLTKAYAKLNSTYPYVRVALQYNFRDNYWGASASEWGDHTGLLRKDFTAKPAFDAFKAYAQSLPNITPTSPPLASLTPTATPQAGATPTPQPNPTPPSANQAPKVSITSPVNGSTFNRSLSIKANASDDKRVTKVEFYFDGKLVHTEYYAPYEFGWRAPKKTSYGNHTLTAKAYDNEGLTSMNSITITRSR